MTKQVQFCPSLSVVQRVPAKTLRETLSNLSQTPAHTAERSRLQRRAESTRRGTGLLSQLQCKFKADVRPKDYKS